MYRADRVGDVAKDAKISRQAVYLHFNSQAKLLVATACHADEVRGLGERLHRSQTATGEVEQLETYVEFRGKLHTGGIQGD